MESQLKIRRSERIFWKEFWKDIDDLFKKYDEKYVDVDKFINSLSQEMDLD